ncbi:MAG: signal peptidase II [Anaerolineales bacterium]|nr:signal peptidase II [Anaerolineales bacterium]
MSEETNAPSRGGRFLTFFLTAFIVVALDQWTKRWVIQNIPLQGQWLPEAWIGLAPYARLLHIQNRGVSFGMFQGGNAFFIVFTSVVVLGILYYVSRMERSSAWMWLAAGMYLGGAVGNLIDRLTLGAVTDFISVGKFYIFNIADASINVSVALLLILSWLHERKSAKAKDEAHERPN